MNNIPTVEANKIFSVDGKLYAICNPRTADQATNVNGHLVFTFFDINEESVRGEIFRLINNEK